MEEKVLIHNTELLGPSNEPVSFIKACQNYFTTPPHGRKVEIAEFKDLTYQDRVELRQMLIEMGYNIPEAIAMPKTSSE